MQAISALDTPLPVTWFENQAGFTATAETVTLRELADRVLATTAAAKADLPWIKLARFGEHRTPKGSLRNNANVLDVSGVEADYDAGLMSVDEAAARLRAAGIAALVYTSPSHMEFIPRWRVLAPCSGPTSPVDRERLTGRINAALGGVLAPESFTLSQGFYLGGLADRDDRRAVLVEGAPIDTVQLEPVFPVRAVAAAIALPRLPPDTSADGQASAMLRAACEAFDVAGSDMGRHQILLSATRTVAPYILAGLLDESDVVEAIEDAMRESGRDANGGEVESAIEWAMRRATPWSSPSDGSEFDVIPAAPPPAAAAARRLFTSRDFRIEAHGSYVVKHLLAPGDVGAILGHPGAGKSTLAPYLAYAVAQGRPFFGLRTRPGRALIVAAEDITGTQKRVAALGSCFGHTDDCAVVEAANLRDPAERAALLATVREYGPSLIVVDTLAAAFAGIEENASQGMGEVLDCARALAATGAAVVLIHHPAKAGDGTPRGHSSLNGALHTVLTLAPDDVTDANTIVRGAMAKNRNGSTAWTLAFRKDVVELGRDSDGDAVTTTLPVAVDTTEARTTPRRLSPNECRALAAIQAAETAQASVTEQDAVDICASISTADKPRDRLRAGRQTFARLLEKGRLVLLDGKVSTLGGAGDGMETG